MTSTYLNSSLPETASPTDEPLPDKGSVRRHGVETCDVLVSEDFSLMKSLSLKKLNRYRFKNNNVKN